MIHGTSYAPYLTIIQISCSGKTRLVAELKTKGIYVLYICKRHDNSSGYPASTPYVHKVLETIQKFKFGVLLSIAIKEIKKIIGVQKSFGIFKLKMNMKKYVIISGKISLSHYHNNCYYSNLCQIMVIPIL